ncbi:MAG: demethylmenaquinone methyltransferase / 2-methoxy-6-polyprenyl,4-benzoquinol methylase [Verrucomicrobiota bacterium]|jgi:demethylmenaquinone methyltransferase/2-methoxy-6-polyprenyl-1,4-benzoquinol methylase
MFGSIARRYDLANHLLSCGIDFYWRKRAAEIVADWRPGRVVDLATGTGDLALALQKRVPEAEIVGVDFVPEMISLAKRKGVRQVMLGDAMALSFPADSFDCVTISFGLRNLSDIGEALHEMKRVLKVNGHVLILEFSIPTLSFLRGSYRFYLHRCLPLVGSFLTQQKRAYDYLGDSIEEFPSGEAMIRSLQMSGFENARFQPLTGGIVTIYTAQKTR